MAGAIKGITVEIGGDTTKLNKALNDVNKQSKSLQSELKGVESLLKMDPGNTELLAQKQQILAESVSNTKDKLETLKSVQAQVKEQFDNGEIGADAYRDFQREIEATEQKLKNLTDVQNEFGSVTAQKVAAAGEKMQEVGGKVEGVGNALMPVTAAVTGLGTASVAAFKQLDEGYDTIVKATGATGEALEGLKDSADFVFMNMNADMSEVGAAIGEVNTRFGSTGVDLENLSMMFLEFSKITGQDVVGAIGNVDKIQEAWNIDADKTNEVLGLLAGKAQETGISVETLEQSVLENNSIFKEMGLTFEQSIGLMAEFEKNGVNSSTAIAGLKKSVQNATKEGKTAQQAVSDINDLGFNFQSVGEVISGAWNGLCEMLAPMFEAAFAEVGTVLQAASDVILGILDVLIGVFTLDWEQAWNGIKEIFGGVWTAISGTLENARDMIMNVFGGFIDSVVDVWTKCWDSVKMFFSETWDSITSSLSSFFSAIINAVSGWGGNMLAKGKDAAKKFLDAVVNTVKELPGKIKAVFDSVISAAASWVSGMAQKGRAAISGLISSVVEGARDIPSKMAEIGKNIVSGVWNGIVAAKDWFVSKVKSFFSGIVDGVKGTLGIHSPSKVFADEVGKWIPSGIGAGITKNRDAALKPLRELFDSPGNIIPMQDISQTVTATLSGGDGITELLSAIYARLDGIGDNRIYLDGRTLVGGVIRHIDAGLSDITAQKARGM